MSEGRRSSRDKKKINYSSFGNGDDDDFTDPTPPPAKKPKTSNKESKLRRKKDTDDDFEMSLQTSGRKRPRVDDRVYDRDLEEALKLSMRASEGLVSADITIETHNTTNSNGEIPEAHVNPCITEHNAVTGCPTSAELDEDIVELDDHPEEDAGIRHRRKPAKPVIYVDDDEDDRGKVKAHLDKDEEYKVENGDAVSDDDYDDNDDDDEFDPDDSDSDYGSSKKKKGKYQPKSSSKTKRTPVKPKPKSNTSVTPVSKAKPAASRRGGAVSKSAVKTTPTTPSNNITPGRSISAGARKTWVPPGRSGTLSSPLGGISIKSPSGGLRLGLSRNQKVKSLHPSLTG